MAELIRAGRCHAWNTQPELPGYLEPILAAFLQLSSSRPVSGMGGAGGIPWPVIQRYAECHGYADDEEELDRFHRLIRALDSAYLKAVVPKKEELTSTKDPRRLL